MKAAISKAKLLMKSKKSQLGRGPPEPELDSADPELSALELQEFLEIESKTRQAGRPSWWQVVPPQRPQGKPSLQPVERPQRSRPDQLSSTPDLPNRRDDRSAAVAKTVQARPQTGPNHRGLQPAKQATSFKNLHLLQSTGTNKRPLESVRRSLAARSDKPSPSSKKQLTSRDVSQFEAAREETRPSNKPTPRHSQQPFAYPPLTSQALLEAPSRRAGLARPSAKKLMRKSSSVDKHRMFLGSSPLFGKRPFHSELYSSVQQSSKAMLKKDVSTQSDIQRKDLQADPASSRPSLRDGRKFVIKVDLEASKHKKLKLTQHVNKVKDIYNSEIQYVRPAHQITMEIMMLHEAVDKIKDEILLHLNNEMRRGIQLIEGTQEKLELEIRSFELDCSKIDAIKRDLSSVFANYAFTVKANDFAKPGENVIDRLTTHQLFKESVSLKQSLRGDDEAKEVFEVADNMTADLNGVSAQTSNIMLLAEVDKPLFSSQVDASKEKPDTSFDPAECVPPDPSDANFNKFLENELERIKKNFLTDSPGKPEFQGQKPTLVADKRPKSIGPTKTSTFANQFTYKQKFEELYKRGKSGKSGSQPKTSKHKGKTDFQSVARQNSNFHSSADHPHRQVFASPKLPPQLAEKTTFLKKLNAKLGTQSASPVFTPLFKAD